MIAYECHEECDLSKGGRCTWKAGPCNWGRFARIIHEQLDRFGEWRIRRFASGPMCATLRGKNGRVEVWGCNYHRNEVWFIEKGTKAETWLACDWSVRDGSLVDAVERGCAMAGIQPRLEIDA